MSNLTDSNHEVDGLLGEHLTRENEFWPGRGCGDRTRTHKLPK